MKLKTLLKSILPGLFLIGFNIGTGSVTAMAKAGANYGMALLWTVALSCIVTYYMILFYSRYTMVTGETALRAFGKHIHPAVGLFFMVALTINVCGGIMGVMGIVADVLHQWSLQWSAGGISALVFAAVIVAIIYLLLFVGTTGFFENILALMVAVLGLSFFINFFMMAPPSKDILLGLVPKIPSTSVGTTGSPFLVTAGMVGTTVSSMIFIVRTTLVKEHGWTMTDNQVQVRDARISAGLMFLISASIMAAAAGTLYVAGVSLDNASDMVTLLEPVAGKYGVALFVIGLTAAGMSSQFPNVLLLPWLLCDYYSLERDMTKPSFRIILFIMSLLGLVVPIFHARPVLVMIASQAFAALLLPATVLCIFYLLNDKKLMGEHVNGWKENVILSLIILFSLVMCGIGLKGFWQEMTKLL